jgi:uncharacterized protein YjbJ (UPF0337 family)
MDKQTIKGSANDAIGSIKRAAGKATGDQRLMAEGAADKIVGKTQKVVGKAKDAARRALNK